MNAPLLILTYSFRDIAQYFYCMTNLIGRNAPIYQANCWWLVCCTGMRFRCLPLSCCALTSILCSHKSYTNNVTNHNYKQLCDSVMLCRFFLYNMLLISFCYALLGSYPFSYKIAILHYQFHFHHLIADGNFNPVYNDAHSGFPTLYFFYTVDFRIWRKTLNSFRRVIRNH